MANIIWEEEVVEVGLEDRVRVDLRDRQGQLLLQLNRLRLLHLKDRV